MSGKGLLLIVDSSVKTRSQLASLLSDEYDILEAGNGSEAVILLNMYYFELSVLFLNPTKTNINSGWGDEGLEILSLLHQNGWIGAFPIVLIRTAETSASLIGRAYRLGVSESVSLPFDEIVVKQRIKNVITLHSKQNTGSHPFDEECRRRIEQCRAVFQLRQDMEKSVSRAEIEEWLAEEARKKP